MSFPNRPVRCMIEALRVRCSEGKEEVSGKKRAVDGSSASDGAPVKSNEGDERFTGCTWEGTLGQWKDEHKKACPFGLLRCSNGCGKRVFRKDQDQHNTEECQYRKVKCDVCGSLVIHSKLNRHQCS